MGIFSLLFACKRVNPVGPVFEESYHKKLACLPDFEMKYKMPGNMTEYFNLAALYAKESPEEMNFDCASRLEMSPENSQWSQALEVDGSIWRYYAKNKKSEANEMATLYISIYLNEREKNTSVEEQITQGYDQYFNGPDGNNTWQRQNNPKLDAFPENEKFLILTPPDDFQWVVINNIGYLQWKVRETVDHEYTYNALEINPDYFLTIKTRYSIVARSDDELAATTKQVESDIQQFMDEIQILSQ